MRQRIGFMQGRLSPLVGGRIQAFPWQHWRDEIAQAERLGFSVMEWTLDQEGLRDNPLLTREGRAEIRSLSAAHGLRIPSVTGDCFMQAPFHKAEGSRKHALLSDFEAVVGACADLGIRCIVIPVVDNGAFENEHHQDVLVKELASRQAMLQTENIRIAFESDFPPIRLRDFMEPLPPESFGINYDIGNSAALGYDPTEEIETYGKRIVNVHVKDRILGGTTVPLGTGNADLPEVFRLLKGSGYAGNYILQTARATDDDHAGALSRYRDMVLTWI